MARYLALLSAAAVALAAPPAASAALRWSGPIPLDHSGATALTAISCPSTTRCVSVDAVGQVVVFNPTKVGAAVPMLVDPIGGFTAVSCPTTIQCTAVDRAGQQVTFDPGAPGGATPVNVSTGQALTALACPAADQCTAVGGVGQAYTFDPTLPSGTQTQISPHAARIATLLKRRGYTLTFTALTAGRLTINWTSVAVAGPARATPGKAGVLVAAGTVSFTKAGTLKLQIKLTAPGRRLLAVARRLRLSARGTFVPTGQSAIIALTRFTLAR